VKNFRPLARARTASAPVRKARPLVLVRRERRGELVLSPVTYCRRCARYWHVALGGPDAAEPCPVCHEPVLLDRVLRSSR
jgi:hypothetical protein